ncbi:MAG TPA: hypothetical protein PKC18_08115, partial [Lacipirellulaceae bacterium]|nr:hypothetical protein [Lacipirellulaceae bacterium]
MVLVFLAFGLVALKNFMVATATEVRSARDLWHLAETAIWTGGEPLPGKLKFTFWHVMFFAWFCNMAMHIGMSDLSVFRFARKSWYGVATASGMYVGHFMAWLAAAMLFAVQLHSSRPDENLTDLLVTHGEGAYTTESLQNAPLTAELVRRGMEIEDQLVAEGIITADQKRVGPPTPLPGPLAYSACGVAGLICVIVAGWTTANPTIYRAGLAFQAIMPRMSRRAVTFATGMLATAAGLFPAIAMQLLDFVALYGMLLMPMGAVVFVDFWLLEKLGLKNEYAARVGSSFNVAAALTWGLTLAACLGAVRYFGRDYMFFVSLPGWFLAVFLYIVLSAALQRRDAGVASYNALP